MVSSWGNARMVLRRHWAAFHDGAYDIDEDAGCVRRVSLCTAADGLGGAKDFGDDLVFEHRTAGGFVDADQIADFEGGCQAIELKDAAGRDADRSDVAGSGSLH